MGDLAKRNVICVLAIAVALSALMRAADSLQQAPLELLVKSLGEADVSRQLIPAEGGFMMRPKCLGGRLAELRIGPVDDFSEGRSITPLGADPTIDTSAFDRLIAKLNVAFPLGRRLNNVGGLVSGNAVVRFFQYEHGALRMDAKARNSDAAIFAIYIWYYRPVSGKVESLEESYMGDPPRADISGWRYYVSPSQRDQLRVGDEVTRAQAAGPIGPSASPTHDSALLPSFANCSQVPRLLLQSTSSRRP